MGGFMYQFVRVEAFGFTKSEKKLNEKYKKETNGRNVEEIIKELKRDPEFSEHVPEPEEPKVLYGVTPDEVEDLTHDYFDNTKLVDRLGRPRALRKDAKVLLAGVISLNREIDFIWDDYKKSAIEWLKEKYGDRLVSVVQHLDEENPHIHFYCIPKHGEKFDILHDGKKAFNEVGGKLRYKKEKAYTEAMRAVQEDFFLKVAADYGLMKTGPRRQRLSNTDYWNQKREIELINQHRKKAKDEADLLLNSVNNEIESQKKKAKSEILILKDETIAKATTQGKNEGFISSIKNFEDKNYFNKFIFSRSFSLNRIEKLEKENKEIKHNYNKLMTRKNNYKKETKDLKKVNSDLKNDLKTTQEKADYYGMMIDFISENENKKEGNENDIRERIIREIDTIEKQQQRLNKTIEQIKPRVDFNERKADTVGERIRKSHRVLFRNLNSFIRDFFRVKLFERKLEEEKTTKVNKYKPETKKQEENNITGKDRKLKLK